MAFRYINPGLVSLLDSRATATQYTGTTFSKTGYAFAQTNSQYCVDFQGISVSDDFWARFDAFIPADGSASTFAVVAPYSESNGFEIEIPASSDGTHNIFYPVNSTPQTAAATGTAAQIGLKRGEVNSFLLHVSPSQQILSLGVNDVTYSASGYTITPIAGYSTIMRLWADGTAVKFSNLILAKAEVSIREQAAQLPISATVTDMTAGASGMYTADAAGQTLLQTPDVAALAQQYGADSKVTGVQVLGKLAHRTGEGLVGMTSLSKTGNDAAIEHSSFSVYTDSTRGVMDGWGLSGVTISGLSDMQFGWKVTE